ncbi:hypothetical protein MMC07_006572 [Pseudocyphellaria aurata]|nr:hypothetical protein [Pseudocyphellaria aurata]
MSVCEQSQGIRPASEKPTGRPQTRKRISQVSEGHDLSKTKNKRSKGIPDCSDRHGSAQRKHRRSQGFAALYGCLALACGVTSSQPRPRKESTRSRGKRIEGAARHTKTEQQCRTPVRARSPPSCVGEGRNTLLATPEAQYDRPATGPAGENSKDDFAGCSLNPASASRDPGKLSQASSRLLVPNVNPQTPTNTCLLVRQPESLTPAERVETEARAAEAQRQAAVQTGALAASVVEAALPSTASWLGK